MGPMAPDDIIDCLTESQRMRCRITPTLSLLDLSAGLE